MSDKLPLAPSEKTLEQQQSRRRFMQNSAGVLLTSFGAGAAPSLLSPAASANVAARDCLAHSPSRDELLARYQRAEVLKQGFSNRRLVLNATLFPHWIGDTHQFWYKRETKTGKDYRLVNVDTGDSRAAFDHRQMASELAKAFGQPVDAKDLPVTDVDIDSTLSAVRFDAFDKRWIFDVTSGHCRALNHYAEEMCISPDGKRAVFVRDHNLWLRDLASGDEKPLTRDGEKFRVYSGTPTIYGRQEASSLEAIWSPDSKSVFTLLIDTRNLKVGPPLVQHVPKDGSLRPRMLRPDRRVAFPQDDDFEGYEFVAINVDTGRIQIADYPKIPMFYPPYVGFFSAQRGWWDDDNRHTWFLAQQRGGLTARVLKFDTWTGRVETVIEERGKTPLVLAPNSHLKPVARALPGNRELIWYSDRSGWSHLYLYDLKTGKLENAITRGEWNVRSILHYDSKRRELFIQTAGRVAGRNPYYCDICRVNIDTGELTEIIASDHDYVVCNQRTRISAGDEKALGVSVDGEYIVATRSRVDQLPVTMLLNRAGKQMLQVEHADGSGLPANWRWPEPVMLKGADGETDIYGVIYRPSDFTPDKSWPVVDCTFYNLIPVGSFTNNSAGNWGYLTPAMIAELGFIAVTFFNRGNDNLRDKKFKNFADPVLPLNPLHWVQHNLADSVAGIQQLAQRYSCMDINRVGITDFGSVASALSGLLVHPDFYKVGVSSFAASDLDMIASMGHFDDDRLKLEDLAANLRGKLLLIHGMLDDVVPVASAFRIVEALQKANRDFDMLLLPNMGHGASDYAIRRQWDYLVEHLLDVEPPKNFKFAQKSDR